MPEGQPSAQPTPRQHAVPRYCRAQSQRASAQPPPLQSQRTSAQPPPPHLIVDAQLPPPAPGRRREAPIPSPGRRCAAQKGCPSRRPRAPCTLPGTSSCPPSLSGACAPRRCCGRRQGGPGWTGQQQAALRMMRPQRSAPLAAASPVCATPPQPCQLCWHHLMLLTAPPAAGSPSATCRTRRPRP